MNTIQLLVVDDHSLFRRGLTTLLAQDGRFHVACEAGDIGEALRCVERQRPDHRRDGYFIFGKGRWFLYCV